jgi:hypothetical protein
MYSPVLLVAVVVAATSIVDPAVARRRARSDATHVVGGLRGHSVHLKCDLPMSNPADIQWYDEVYNSGIEPQLIFDSNTGSDIVSDHPACSSIHVDGEYTLTISNLQIDRGPGKYFCMSRNPDGAVAKRVFQLTVIELPECTGVGDYKAGQKMFLDCKLPYSGTMPTVQWYRTIPPSRRHRHEREQLVDSEDHFDLLDTPVARKTVINKAHAIDDGSTYRCKVSIGHLHRECDINVTVKFLVQDLELHPEDDQVSAGDVVECSARGNPIPAINIEPPEVDEAGPGWMAIVVGDELVGKTLDVRCSASNSLDGTTENLETSRTFHIRERQVPSEPNPVPTPDDHERVPHHSHPPKNDNNEKDLSGGDTLSAEDEKPPNSDAPTYSAVHAAINAVLSALFVALFLN